MRTAVLLCCAGVLLSLGVTTGARAQAVARSSGAPGLTRPDSVLQTFVRGMKAALEMEGHSTRGVRAGEAFVEPPNVRMTGYNRSTMSPTVHGSRRAAIRCIGVVAA